MSSALQAVTATGSNGSRRCSQGIHIAPSSAIVIRSDAGIAQLVEHDLAKVGVASSSLVSRSSFKQNLGEPRFCFLKRNPTCYGCGSAQWPGGRVVMQRPAKPCTPVRFRPWPPLRRKKKKRPCGALFFRASGTCCLDTSPALVCVFLQAYPSASIAMRAAKQSVRKLMQAAFFNCHDLSGGPISQGNVKEKAGF